MRKLFKIILLISLVVIGYFLFRSYLNKDARKTELQIPSELFALTGYNQDELEELLAGIGKQNYTRLVQNDTGDFIVDLTNGQMKKWKDEVHNRIASLQKEIKKRGTENRLGFVDEYTKITLYVNDSFSNKEIKDYFMDAKVLAICYQLVTGQSDIKLEYELYDADTDELLASGNLLEELSFKRD